ncbi:MAG TPA: hypothetical protein PLH97_07645 [Verrucomicrobiota bacterium]|nr:hypothetical protein [Verrucomicrobiota bacterium]HOP98259.1 hypothetical protein [Verrucomicrobiota bacterium]HPU56137.1 hypothetical protein [Verrucomicrobiota bacterium]
MKLDSEVSYQLVPRTDLTPSDKSAMHGLLARHFDGVTPEQFARDLAEKDLALLLQRGSEIVGFSTLLAYSIRFEGETIRVIYSGDTIVAREAWGTTALPRAWVAGVEALRAAAPAERCFWLLLTSGFRTYRFLPVFWREFFPRFDAPTPDAMQRLLNQLASDRFGSQFDPVAGVVRFRNPQRLCGGLEQIPPGRESDPHVAFFCKRNPGHANGDELVCLTEVCPENLTPAGRRMMRGTAALAAQPSSLS